jgi:DNA polymerase-1
MINAALIDEHRFAYDLDSVAFDYVGVRKKDIWPRLAEIFGGEPTKKAQIGNLPHAPKEIVAEYAIGDTRATYKLWERQRHIIDADRLNRVHALEHRLLPKIIRMEQYGVPVNIEQAEKAVTEMALEINRQQHQLNKMAGFEVNVNPSNSLKKLFAPRQDDKGTWFAKDGTRLQATDGGNACLDQWALKKIKMREAELVLSIRSMRRTKETFLEGHILGHHHNGIIHANYNQTKSDNDKGTGTGRFSINDPALQQIHKRNKTIAAIVRACFVPDDGDLWYCRDWSQMDFRVFAHYAKDPGILRAYREDPETDFHSTVAEITGLPRDRDENTGGGNAKQINLGLVFGMGPGRMAEEMGLPFTKHTGRGGKEYLRPGEEAEDLFDRYHSSVPGVQRVLDNVAAVAKRRGHIRTAMGRSIRFPNAGFHKAAGLLFQGTAADALKVKICEVDDYLTTKDMGRLMLNVHDEFDCSIDPEAVDRADIGIKTIIESFGPDDEISFRVPISSDHGTGDNWWEASKKGALPWNTYLKNTHGGNRGNM